MRTIITLALLAAFLAPPAFAKSSRSFRHRFTYRTTCVRDSHGRIKRSSSARTQFLKSEGLKSTPKGCQVDRAKPLAKGGTDSTANTQLLYGPDLKAKEATELK